MTLSGETAAAVEKSARGAVFDSLYSQSTGSWAVIHTLPKSTMVGELLSQTLEDLGYGDLSVYGTQEQTLQFNLPLSSTWSVDSEAWLDLHFNHSVLLNRNRSTLSILINSIPISSIALTPENAEDGYEEVLIPLRYLEIGNNTITLQANMSYTNNVTDMENYCTDNTYPRAWLTVQASSAVRFPDVSQQTPLNISNFPFGFANPYSFEGFAYALPESAGISEFTTLKDLAFTFGKAMLGNPTDIQLVYAGDDLAAYDAFNNVILLGEVQALVTPGLNDRLPLPFDSDTGQLESTDAIMQVDSSGNQKAYLE
ncbi:MAG: cellulose biosynthesis cyclic di-GMP-binding regulatory protein BcsB, partial [Sedimentisphaerales bacterium]